MRYPLRVALLTLLAALPCGACTHPQPRDRVVDEGKAAAVRECLDRPADALRAAIPDDRQLRFAQRVSCIESALTGAQLVPGNEVSLLVDGPQTHDAQLAAIDKAKYHVHLLIYIFTSDDLGKRYLAAFEKARQRGVKVRLIVDAAGSRGMTDEFRGQLRKAGVELFVAGPQNPAEDPKHWQLSHRDHRKILVVDGRVAFTGGANVTDEYEEEPGASKTSSGWRDTNVQVEGPAVADFQRLFIAAWEDARGTIEPSPHYYPKLEKRGDELVRVVRNEGKDVSAAALSSIVGVAEREDNPDSDIYASYLVAIGEARQRVWITQAYFVPNKAFMQALKDAAKRGVDVRVLVPGYTDISTMLHASRWYYDQLLAAGIKVYEYSKPEAVLHAKTAVIDGVWATVGSSNLDFRSFIHNDEANAIVLGPRFAQQMEKMYHDDLGSSRAITRTAWDDRGLRERFLEDWSILFRYWI